MEERKRKKPLQWHPAFYVGLQIELDEESENLCFENEHQLGTKPKQIDVLVIKKDTNKPIRKNIGRIFRKYNIIEYKSPEDYLSIDDFYKVYGYACFYKADVATVDEIKVDDLTITLVTHNQPRKLMKHLSENGYELKQIEKGIYYIDGFQIPIQIIQTSKLSEEENLWLRSLSNTLHEEETAMKLLTEYGKNKQDSRYESMMNLIVNANREIFDEESERMCQALMEIMEEKMKDQIEETRIEGRNEGKIEGRAEEIVETGMEFGLSETAILDRLQKKLNVSVQKAEEYINMFGKQMV